eukprot:Rmarinus@m.10728
MGGYDAQPSKVLLVRSVPLDSTRESVTEIFSQFGRVIYVIIMPEKGQALVEFSSLEEAKKAMQSNDAQPIFVGYNTVQCVYSTNQTLSRRDGSLSQGSNRVLLFNILNPSYEITTDVMYQVTSTYGKVLRIVVMKKTGVQALVEFETAQQAAAAKAALEGHNIYEGCCTMMITYSTLRELTVRTNSSRTRDYTNPSLPTGSITSSSMAAPSAASGQEKVVIAHNLSETVTCDQVFNLFCAYGPIVRVRLMYQKKGAAMVQFADHTQASQATNSLNGAQVFGQVLDVRFSKHENVACASQEELESMATTGQVRVKEFSSSPLNHFAIGHDIINAYDPSKVLYFYNVPGDEKFQVVLNSLTRMGAETPKKHRFVARSPPKKSFGLMEWSTVEAATNALLLANNAPLSDSTLRLHFSDRVVDDSLPPVPMPPPATPPFAAGGVPGAQMAYQQQAVGGGVAGAAYGAQAQGQVPGQTPYGYVGAQQPQLQQQPQQFQQSMQAPSYDQPPYQPQQPQQQLGQYGQYGTEAGGGMVGMPGSQGGYVDPYGGYPQQPTPAGYYQGAYPQTGYYAPQGGAGQGQTQGPPTQVPPQQYSQPPAYGGAPTYQPQQGMVQQQQQQPPPHQPGTQQIMSQPGQQGQQGQQVSQGPPLSQQQPYPPQQPQSHPPQLQQQQWAPSGPQSQSQWAHAQPLGAYPPNLQPRGQPEGQPQGQPPQQPMGGGRGGYYGGGPGGGRGG